MPEFVGRLRTPRLASAPATPVVGELYYDTVGNDLLWWNGSAWVSAPAFRVGHTWALGGVLTAAINVPHIYVPKAARQVATLVGARAVLGSGTSIVCQLQRNGSNLGSTISVTTTAATTVFSQALADGDAIDLVLSSPVGSPTDLSFTLIIEHQL
jgi:hypothetical protein